MSYEAALADYNAIMAQLKDPMPMVPAGGGEQVRSLCPATGHGTARKPSAWRSFVLSLTPYGWITGHCFDGCNETAVLEGLGRDSWPDHSRRGYPAPRCIGPARLDCTDEYGTRLYRAELWDDRLLDADGWPIGDVTFYVQRPNSDAPGATWQRHPVPSPERFILEALEASVAERSKGGPTSVPTLRLSAAQLERLRGTDWGADA